MLNPKYLNNRTEQHEPYTSAITKKALVQYDYRHTNGELFSCVRPTLEKCREARDKWIQEQESVLSEIVAKGTNSEKSVGAKPLNQEVER